MQRDMALPWWKRMVALGSIITWMVWAYVRLMPPSTMIRHGQLLINRYNAWSYDHLAYSDVVKLYQTRFLFLHFVPYIQNRIEYPVVMGLFMWLTSLGHGVSLYFFITFSVFTMVALSVYFVMERLVPQQAIYFGVLPLLMVYGLLNWDLLGIGFMVFGWYGYKRHAYVPSAILFSLGVFAKLFPIFFLPFIATELWRTGQRKTLGRMVVTFAVTAVVVNGPFILGNWKNWAYFFTFNAGRGLGADIYANPWIHGISTAAANAFSLMVVVATVLYFMWRVYRGGRVVEATALSFTVFLIVNKVYSPQYTLWVFVLAILAEWPVWTYVVITLAGLTDYVNSFTVLQLLSTKSPSGRWYVDHVFFLGVLYRYLSLLVSGAGAALTRQTAGRRSQNISLDAELPAS
ncbi:glycosyltransferase 87 family protein [Sulfobacillus harzensis]|uniref:DUF2029 domain-containing protein n=1 Tax=Sulfobacillus harzensis TaxID=2729629 RepID=A0A7Y0Q5R7_9FIRM|nr:glycosyltransferase 87 family protein [Sulfobacillus harzensis]NMP24589.1 DUF2029 domain-containing protein [Sulfobacillus harzensis]